jgi:hypothetical protein
LNVSIASSTTFKNRRIEVMKRYRELFVTLGILYILMMSMVNFWLKREDYPFSKFAMYSYLADRQAPQLRVRFVDGEGVYHFMDDVDVPDLLERRLVNLATTGKDQASALHDELVHVLDVATKFKPELRFSGVEVVAFRWEDIRYRKKLLSEEVIDQYYWDSK